jgi:DNA-binding transcriptional LysR family regulator
MAGLRNVTMRQLQIFSSAARHLNFSRTSEELHLTQPAVSMQIKQLEESAGLRCSSGPAGGSS